ncbi:MAG: UbiA family prenyltransferase [Bacteroidetes bacterium]|nr:UbiA family prenyltransferase [Bacteroidota bacterium]
MNTLQKYLSLVKFSHTIFALPFAVIGYCLALRANCAPFNFFKFAMVLLCMVFARSAAMAFNRYIDRSFDAKNPRTAIREIPSGQISSVSAAMFTIICSVGFMVCSYMINSLCFYLSPVALLVVLGYSYTKRFTPLCHLILGLGLALAPVGAYIALTEQFALLPVLFGCVVLFWVSGFDIIYALQDEEFDRRNNLKSIPVLLGTKGALRFSEVLHLFSAGFVIAAFFIGNFNWLYLTGAGLFIGLLYYQHSIVKPNDLSKVNMAFMRANGIASVIFSAFVCVDIFVY